MVIIYLIHHLQFIYNMAYQVSVFLENKAGQFRNVTSVLRETGVNIQSMTLSTTTMGWGILNLIVDNPQKAEEALKAKHHPVALRKVIALAMDDNVGGLDAVLSYLEKADINMETAYGRNRNSNGKAVLIVDVNDVEDAEKRLIQHGANLLSDEEVYQL